MKDPKNKQKLKPESPVLTFNEICFGYFNNDWSMVASRAFVLFYSLVIIIFSFAVKHLPTHLAVGR